jgi:cytosine/adenosine deaminase-related metal-dependent hydrolase
MRALGWDAGKMEPGMLADFVTLQPRLAPDAAGLVFGSSASDVMTVVVGGKVMVSA